MATASPDHGPDVLEIRQNLLEVPGPGGMRSYAPGPISYWLNGEEITPERFAEIAAEYDPPAWPPAIPPGVPWPGTAAESNAAIRENMDWGDS